MPFPLSERASLENLGILHNTDKASSWRGIDNNLDLMQGHDYLRKYELFLEPFTHVEGFKMLELGAGPGSNIGASARVWNDYFPLATEIAVVDIQSEVAVLSEISDKLNPIRGDLGDPSFVSSLAESAYDFIIDDASHFWEHQLLAFELLFPSLNAGGVYICEDIQTSFGGYRSDYGKGFKLDSYTFFSMLSLFVSSESVPGASAHPGIQSLLSSLGICFLEDRQLRLLRGLADLSRKCSSVTFIKHACIIQKCKS